MSTRDFTAYIVNSTDTSGPKLTFGDQAVTFKKKQPLAAVIALFDEGSGNPLDRSKNYLRLAALDESKPVLENFFDTVEAEGLSEAVNWLTTEYSGFPTEKSPA